MALVKSWDPIIEKFSKRLSNWKASLLPIGGRATLISSVLGAIDLHPADGPETRWNKLLPKKINIFTWRTLHDRLPSRWNLSRKGIEVTSLNCP
nr:RNA-directed DNA polymerase, eukaryota [Tanacetum cinerariifolium]